jgi:hypothetical protein
VRAVILIRANGLNERVQGDVGAQLVLADDEASFMVERKFAVYDPVRQAQLDGAPSPETTFVGTEAAAARLNELVQARKRDEAVQALVDLTEEMGLYDEPVVDQDALEAGHPLDVDPEPAVKRPYGNASKAAWIDWAVRQGADEAGAAELTKNQLMARYGERL